MSNLEEVISAMRQDLEWIKKALENIKDESGENYRCCMTRIDASERRLNKLEIEIGSRAYQVRMFDVLITTMLGAMALKIFNLV